MRNGLGVSVERGRVRAASATASSQKVVLDGAAESVATALRDALAAAREHFGEPDAIALVHDDADDADTVGRDLAAAGVGPVRLVARSIAGRYADDPATGAALWLLDERHPVVPLIPPAGPPGGSREAQVPGPSMSDFGDGRQMSDFGDGRQMSDFGAGVTMDDFGGGSGMDDFGDGVTMADFADQAPRRRSRVLIATLAAAIVLLVAAVAAIALTSDAPEAEPVAATETTEVGASETDSEAASSTSEALQPGAPGSGPPADAASTTSTTVATSTAGTTATTAATATTATTAKVTAATTTTVPVNSDTTTYDVTAMVQSYSGGNPDAPRLQQGMQAPGVVSLTCDANRRCTGTITIKTWTYQQTFEGTLGVDGTFKYANTAPRRECVDGATVTNSFSATFGTGVSGDSAITNDPQVCKTADGTQSVAENVAITFATNTP